MICIWVHAAKASIPMWKVDAYIWVYIHIHNMHGSSMNSCLRGTICTVCVEHVRWFIGGSIKLYIHEPRFVRQTGAAVKKAWRLRVMKVSERVCMRVVLYNNDQEFTWPVIAPFVADYAETIYYSTWIVRLVYSSLIHDTSSKSKNSFL